MSLPPVEVMTCHRCGSKTRWLIGRGGKFSRCEGCNDRFPCAHACAHLDCKDAREVSGPTASSVTKGHDKLAPEATHEAGDPGERTGDVDGSTDEPLDVAGPKT